MTTHGSREEKSKNDLRRTFFDAVFALLFLIAIGGAIVSHTLGGRDEHARYLEEREAQLRAQIASEEAQKERDKQEALRRAIEDNVPATSTEDELTTEADENNVDLLLPDFETNTSTDIALDQKEQTVRGYVRFEDVTAVRYQNDRLGFVMELPANWPVVYERGSDVAFANAIFPAGVTDSTIEARGGSMWLRVFRPCEATEATSTVFRFASTSREYIREASACVAPFLVTLGYRADAPDWFGRERFLLSIARTFYPIVQSTAPYRPLR